MAYEGKIQIEKFNGTDFVWWKMQMEALLSQRDLDMVLEDKPEKMDAAAESAWNSKDKKARGAITLALTRSVAFNIMHETTARGMMLALSNMYEKPSAANKVFLMRELFMTRMNEGSSVTVHINNLNSILSRLSSVGFKFDDEMKVVLMLSSLPDSWSGTVTAVTSSVGTTDMTFEGIRDIVLGEDVRRKSTSAGSSSEMLHVGRGRGNNRSSGSRGRSLSKTRKNVKCWSCNELGHVKSQCPGTSKQMNAADGVYDDDALVCSTESCVDSWVMDSGASFHAMDNGETMLNLKKGDFGKVRLANDELLEVMSMGDVDLIFMAEDQKGRIVCVTGAGGFVGSWLVKHLLAKNYTVHGTLTRFLSVDEKYVHLKKLEKASENLKLFKADLLDYESLRAAIAGCDGVFHTASPVPPSSVPDPEAKLIKPAVDGTLNVLKACCEVDIKRVVYVSSVAAIMMTPNRPQDRPMDETSWSDQEFCKSNNDWYCLSKTIAESEAFEFSKRNGIELLSLCPTLVVGPMLQKTVNASNLALIKLLRGDSQLHFGAVNNFSNVSFSVLAEGYEELENRLRLIVDVRDVAEALILVYEKPEANGRYICSSHEIRSNILVEILKKYYPDYNYPKK
ncbi:hypothetical protein E3N88_37995 [Mikania micrantha]|uniref:Dihydroflavonol 4-reductase n=1 Tax=Mikania micrantha TaxID=192012 RepID=A0A5N6LSP6_9ASTR|nr:hypothetical protein E3N88_37995 [Mikania micrantha]